jgi:hypothetical protein
VDNDGLKYEKENPDGARFWYWLMSEAKGIEGDYHQKMWTFSVCVRR